MKLFKLNNTVKYYDWGSPQWIPQLLGRENPRKEPWAELWMGVHPEGPSTTEIEGRTVNLREVSGDLPFLFKFLAAARPLSLQAHPNLEQARAGFERENKAGIPLSSPKRNYKDPNHKPEILCALTPFTAMAGFREKSETGDLLRRFFSPASGRAAELGGKLLSALEGGYGELLSVLFGAAEAEREALAALAVSAGAGGSADPVFSLCARFVPAGAPADPGILSPLYLNVVELKPFEAVFLPAGILHAYVHGFGMECMANSDNVLRGGLTSKYIDPPELFRVLNFAPFKPEILTGEEVSPSCFRYKTCGEFSLYRLKGAQAALEEPQGAVIAVTEGPVRLDACTLAGGESAYIPPRESGETLLFKGGRMPAEFTLFAALSPK